MSDQLAHGRMLLKVCYQFYQLGLSQTEIASRLGMSRFQVARMLRTALDDGYVTVKILEPERWHPDLERAIEERYELDAAIVVDDDGLTDEEIKRRIADAAGRYLLEILADGDILGVSLGSTIGTLVEQLPQRIGKRVDVVQLIGGGPQSDHNLTPGIVATELAHRFRTRPHLLHAPAIVEHQSLRDSLLADPTIRGTYTMYGRLTTAILGIGALTHGTTSRLVYSDLIDDSLLKSLLADGAVGDVLAYVYREDGSCVPSPLDQRVIAIPLQTLLDVPRRIGVAGGVLKTRAIQGALHGRFINVLVTDSITAQKLVQEEEDTAANGSAEETAS